MADISALINYDQTFPVAIKNPVTGEDVGITFNLVSMESERVAVVDKLIDTERWQAVFESKDKKLTPEMIAKFGDKAERERLIAAIDGWNWGGNEFGNLGADPECNAENKRYVIEHPNARWIRSQLEAKAADLVNFSQPSKKPARNTSK